MSDLVQKFNFDYKNKDANKIKALLDVYNQRILDFYADRDVNDYSYLNGT